MDGTDHAAAVITLFTRSGVSTQVAVYKVANDQITDIWLYEQEPIEHRRGLQLSQELQAAVVARDAVKLEELLANEFVLTGSERLGVLGKSEWLDAALNRFSWQRFDFGASAGFSADETEVVSFFLEQQGHLGGVDVSGRFFAVDVWKRSDQRWQLVTRFAKRIDEV